MVVGKRSKTGDGLTDGLYYGRNPDLFRMYDKFSEVAYRRRPLHFPFSTWAGNDPPHTVTRVERQLRGAKIPPNLKYFGSLKGAGEYDPFALIRFEKCCQKPFGESTVRNALAATGLQVLVETQGLQTARALINKYSRGNASRLMKSLSSSRPVAGPDLYEIYRIETLVQLGGD